MFVLYFSELQRCRKISHFPSVCVKRMLERRGASVEWRVLSNPLWEMSLVAVRGGAFQKKKQVDLAGGYDDARRRSRTYAPDRIGS